MKIKQNDKRLIKPIYDEGCYFWHPINIYSKLTAVEPTIEDIHEIYNYAVKTNAINKDCYMNTGAVQLIFAICTLLFKKDAAGVFLYKERIDGSKFDIMREDLPVTNWLALYIASLNGKTYGHFVEVNNPQENILIDDPWPNSNAVKNGFIKSYRAIHAKRV